MPNSEHSISTVEAAYDLSASDDEWFPRVLDAAKPLFDQGLGFSGLVAWKPPTFGPLEINQVHVVSGRPDFPALHGAASQEMPPQQIYDQTQPGFWILSELTARTAGQLEIWRKHVDYARDAFGIIALDPDGHGVQLMAPLPELPTVTRAEREGWNMLAAHLSAGLRLRRAIATTSPVSDDREGLPFGAEAVLDGSKLEVVDAHEDIADARGMLREAAKRVDRARGRLRRDAPREALDTWWALMSGRWSMVDWFDSDDRRYVLALRNEPRVEDPRGLTPRERQVVAYAAMGESHKVIAYRLGISRPTVTNALRTAMSKLGIQTQAELVERLKPFVSHS